MHRTTPDGGERTLPGEGWPTGPNIVLTTVPVPLPLGGLRVGRGGESVASRPRRRAPPSCIPAVARLLTWEQKKVSGSHGKCA